MAPSHSIYPLFLTYLTFLKGVSPTFPTNKAIAANNISFLMQHIIAYYLLIQVKIQPFSHEKAKANHGHQLNQDRNTYGFLSSA
jgi:hypothetical protein